jgi:GT2 family glycosyltransferase
VGTTPPARVVAFVKIMKLAIVIVSYNGKRWLSATLASCLRCSPQVPVYVVDNASTDGSADFITQKFPNIHLIRETNNFGFAGGNNIGMKIALDQGAEAIFLLNQDAELTPGCLEKLSNYLSSNPRVAAVQPAIFLPDGRVNTVGNSFHYLGFGWTTGNGLSWPEVQKIVPWVETQSEIPYWSGAAVLIRSQALTEVGLFDKFLFLYHEDLELSFRLRQAGWKLKLLPTARAIHHFELYRSRTKWYYMERNRYLVWLSYFKIRTLLVLAVPWLLSEIVLVLGTLVSGWWRQKFNSYGVLFKLDTWRYLKQKRTELRWLGFKNDRDFLQFASDRLPKNIAEAGGVRGIVTLVANMVSIFVWKIIYLLIWW